MEVLSHRGFWNEPAEKNTTTAFRRSFEHGFGVETDVRDCAGKLLISHDLPRGTELEFSAFLDLYCNYGQPGVLALNIKADGLQEPVAQCLKQRGIERYFLFDMSVPDMLRTARSGLRFYTRQSEFEKEPLSLYKEAEGVWLDSFESDWIEPGVVAAHLECGKRVCLVSPELHRRPQEGFWEKFVPLSKLAGDKLLLCTDTPLKAKEYFRG